MQSVLLWQVGQGIDPQPRTIPGISAEATDRISWRHRENPTPDICCMLIATQYRNALDEWADGYPKTAKLESEDYAEVYDAILAALEEVEAHEVDGPLLKQRLASWAGFGA